MPPTQRWTPESIATAMRDWYERTGHSPSSTEWLASIPTCPSSTTVFSVFGTWAAALDYAGLPPVTPRGRRDSPKPLLPGDGDRRHGTENGYNNLGCRCPFCKKAHADLYRERDYVGKMRDRRAKGTCSMEECDKKKDRSYLTGYCHRHNIDMGLKPNRSGS